MEADFKARRSPKTGRERIRMGTLACIEAFLPEPHGSWTQGCIINYWTNRNILNPSPGAVICCDYDQIQSGICTWFCLFRGTGKQARWGSTTPLRTTEREPDAASLTGMKGTKLAERRLQNQSFAILIFPREHKINPLCISLFGLSSATTWN